MDKIITTPSNSTTSSDCQHPSFTPLGILLTNLGTPAAPTPKALRRYLKEFLWDPRVVEIYRPLWWLLLHTLVLPFRAGRSAKIYQAIWTPQGSPLLLNMQQLTEKLTTQLQQVLEVPIVLSLGMRYGNPSIAEGLAQLQQAKVQRILVLPLYPQYASATTGSTFVAVSDILKTWRWIPELHFINHYADFPDYINALAMSIQNHWQTSGKKRYLLFSFHGIPKRAQLAGDPYYCYCHKTARLIAAKLELANDEWAMVFQSRFGKAQWLQPYCDQILVELPRKGIVEADIICPGFAVDCLETLEEIAINNRALFIKAGGKELHYIPALNASSAQIDLLTTLIQQHILSWQTDIKVR